MLQFLTVPHKKLRKRKNECLGSIPALLVFFCSVGSKRENKKKQRRFCLEAAFEEHLRRVSQENRDTVLMSERFRHTGAAAHQFGSAELNSGMESA
jgi:hypothetical protein